MSNIFRELRDVDKAITRADRRAGAGRHCKNQHASYLSRGYRFCPMCAAKLEIYRSCPTCGKTFLSKKSFTFHVLIHRRLDWKNVEIVCPKCGSRHKVRRNEYHNYYGTVCGYYCTCERCGKQFRIKKPGVLQPGRGK